MTTESTKPILLRVPTNQIALLEKLKNEKSLKNVQALIYRLIEQEISKNIDDGHHKAL